MRTRWVGRETVNAFAVSGAGMVVEYIVYVMMRKRKKMCVWSLDRDFRGSR